MKRSACILFFIFFFSTIILSAEIAIKIDTVSYKFTSKSPAIDNAVAVLKLPVTHDKEIDKLIGIEVVLEESINDIKNDFASGEFPVDNLDFKVNLNSGKIIQIEYTIQSTGAYTTIWNLIKSIDVKNKKEIKINDILSGNGISEITRKLKNIFEKYKDDSIKNSKNNKDVPDYLLDLLKNEEYNNDMIKDFRLYGGYMEFRISFESIPHALLYFKPKEKIVRYNYKDILNLIKSDSILKSIF